MAGEHVTQMQGMGLLSSLGFVLPSWCIGQLHLGGEHSRILLRGHAPVGMNPQQNNSWNKRFVYSLLLTQLMDFDMNFLHHHGKKCP